MFWIKMMSKETPMQLNKEQETKEVLVSTQVPAPVIQPCMDSKTRMSSEMNESRL